MLAGQELNPCGVWLVPSRSPASTALPPQVALEVDQPRVPPRNSSQLNSSMDWASSKPPGGRPLLPPPGGCEPAGSRWVASLYSEQGTTFSERHQLMEACLLLSDLAAEGLDRVLLGTLKEDSEGPVVVFRPLRGCPVEDVIHSPHVSSEGKDPDTQVHRRQTWLNPERLSQLA